MKKILVLAPHTDDGEIGCGGTIAKFIEEGDKVYYAAFSSASDSLPKHLPDDTLKKELYKAINILGISDKNVIVFDYKVRHLSYHRQEILDDMIKLNLKINPDLVFTPATTDIHQDHQTVTQECIRAFKKTTILGYEEPWNNFNFQSTCLIILKNKHLKKKLDALSEYKSQKYRKYLTTDFFLGLAKTRGVQIDQELAESFEVIRWIIGKEDYPLRKKAK